MEVGLGPGHIALNGDPAPLKKETQTPPFSAHVCCGQTAGMIKMPLGTDSGLGPGDIMLDRDPASPAQKRGTAVPQLFGPCLLWLKGWMDQDVIWYGGRPWPKPHCSRWGPSSPPPKKGAQQPHHFSAHVYRGQTARYRSRCHLVRWYASAQIMC